MGMGVIVQRDGGGERETPSWLTWVSEWVWVSVVEEMEVERDTILDNMGECVGVGCQ